MTHQEKPKKETGTTLKLFQQPIYDSTRGAHSKLQLRRRPLPHTEEILYKTVKRPKALTTGTSN